MQRELSVMDSNSARDAGGVLDRPGDMAQDRPNLFYERIGYATSLLPHTTLAQPLTFLHSQGRDKHPIPTNKCTHIGVTQESDPVWITEVREAVKGLSAGLAAYAPSPVATDVRTKMSNPILVGAKLNRDGR